MAQQEYQDDYGYEYRPDEEYEQPAPVFDPGTPTGWVDDVLSTYPPTPDPTQPPPPAPPTPPPPQPPGGGGGGSNPYTPSAGGSGYSTPTTFNVSSSWPGFTPPPLPTIDPMVAPPAFSYESYAAPSPFSYEAYQPGKFTAPTLEQAAAEPGYEFARREGQRALENSASARGVARTGGTLKDFIGWGNKFAEQNYGNVYNRAANTFGLNEQTNEKAYGLNRDSAFGTWAGNELARAQTYDRNRSNAFDSYKTNYDINRDVYGTNKGTALDLFDRSFQSELAKFNPQFTAAQLTFADIYNRDRDKLNSLTNIATAGAGV